MDWTKTTKKGNPKVTRFGTPTKGVLWGAIKAHCAECMGSKYQVADCTSPRCSLFLYRLGVGRLAEAAIIPPQAAPNVDPAEVGGGHGEAA